MIVTPAQVRVVVARHPLHAVDLHLRRDPALLPAPQPRRLAGAGDLLLGGSAPLGPARARSAPPGAARPRSARERAHPVLCSTD